MGMNIRVENGDVVQICDAEPEQQQQQNQWYQHKQSAATSPGPVPVTPEVEQAVQGGFGDMISQLQSGIQAAKAADPDSNAFHTHQANITQRTQVQKIMLTNAPVRLFNPIKLNLELVPQSAWYQNIRGICTTQTWDVIRKRVYAAYNHVCGICGGVGTQHPVECHETWVFDDIYKVVGLAGFIALCPACHSVKHLGNTQVRGGDQAVLIAMNHMARVNGISVQECNLHAMHANDMYKIRSQYAWQLNRDSLVQHAPELIQDSKFLTLI
jgi:hypothetical protein